MFGSHCFNSPSPPRSRLPSHHSTLFSFFREKNKKNMKKNSKQEKKKKEMKIKTGLKTKTIKTTKSRAQT